LIYKRRGVNPGLNPGFGVLRCGLSIGTEERFRECVIDKLKYISYKEKAAVDRKDRVIRTARREARRKGQEHEWLSRKNSYRK
jgi:hypothetical protein